MQQIETIDDAMSFIDNLITCNEYKETAGLYLQFINQYLENATIPQLEDDASPLMRYVVSLMQNPFIQVMVFTKPAMNVVFRSTTMRYVLERIKQLNFQRRCAQSAARDIQQGYQFSPNMRGTEWKTLVSKVAYQYEDYGFNKKFMEQLLDKDGALQPQKWNKLIIDWATALQNKLNKHEVDSEYSTETKMFKAIEQADREIENFIQSSKISDKELFEQTIELMHGIWNRSEYERLKHIARLQKRFPSIIDVVNIMGRQTDEDGKRTIRINTGSSMKLEHSSGSDIEGITTSRQLTSLLPLELVLYSDEQLKDLFWHKYLQGNLQTLRYRSFLAKPTRSLSTVTKAKTKGPMIVCVDTSSSMSGAPMRIVQSILGRIVWMAHRQARNCYLIYYSVGIKCIDLKFSNWAIDELNQIQMGGTDATKMLNEVFRVLNQEENYMSADVLWISDFLVPDVSKKLQMQMNEYRNTDTHFYGYQIGDRDTIWSSRFDKIYQCLC